MAVLQRGKLIVGAMRNTAGINWAGWPTRFVLFTGKGGVGKTTIASSVAIALADVGRRVLLVSTDPASNLSDVFEMSTNEHPTPVPLVAGLDIMDLDPQEAADEYRARVIGPYRGVLPEGEVAALEEKLAGACTVEVAAFDAFARLLADPSAIGDYDQVVFDTAPTGHTLRLLSLPAAWSGYLAANPDATSCLGPLAGLQDDRPMYAAAVDALADPKRTTLVLVARPDRGALAVAASASGELRRLGIANQQLVINGVLTRPKPGDQVAEALAADQQRAIDALPSPLDQLASCVVPLVPRDLVGVDAVRTLIAGHTDAVQSVASPPTAADGSHAGDLADLVGRLEEPGHGVILVTGKGGVGKTTVAQYIAIELARRGHPVHLTTTDPAGHALSGAAGLPRLTTSAIDPDEATRAYVHGRLDAAARGGLDDAHLELLAEDLRSPCSQEVAVFQAFRQLLRRARTEYVVIDTAPTGHTLLLLDTTGAFHRQVTQDLAHHGGHVITPLMRLQDRDYSRVLIVTLAETTPVAEATALQDDLRRAGIEPFGWVVNATLDGSGTTDPILTGRASHERAHMTHIATVASQAWVLPWSPALATAADAGGPRGGVAR